MLLLLKPKKKIDYLDETFISFQKEMNLKVFNKSKSTNLIIMNYPRGSSDVKFIVKHLNIGMLVNCSPDKYDFDPNDKMTEEQQISVQYFDTSLGFDQIDQFLQQSKKIFNQKKSVVVHGSKNQDSDPKILIVFYLIFEKRYNVKKSISIMEKKHHYFFTPEEIEFIGKYVKQLKEKRLNEIFQSF